MDIYKQLRSKIRTLPVRGFIIQAEGLSRDPPINPALAEEVLKGWEWPLPTSQASPPFSVIVVQSESGLGRKLNSSQSILLFTSHSDKRLKHKAKKKKKIRDYPRILIISVILATNSVSNRKLAWISYGFFKVNNLLDAKGFNPANQKRPYSSISIYLGWALWTEHSLPFTRCWGAWQSV